MTALIGFLYLAALATGVCGWLSDRIVAWKRAHR